MNREEIIKILEQSGAMKNGHFLLASGKHSEKYVQCAKLFERPEYAEKLVAELISELDTEQIDTVAGPAVGAVIMAYEVARQLGKRVIFTERKDGVMLLRRGFEIVPGERILVVEDVVTSGGSVEETMQLLEEMGAHIEVIASIIDRSVKEPFQERKYIRLIKMELPLYSPEDCPLCKDNIPLYAPGTKQKGNTL